MVANVAPVLEADDECLALADPQVREGIRVFVCRDAAHVVLDPYVAWLGPEQGQRSAKAAKRPAYWPEFREEVARRCPLTGSQLDVLLVSADDSGSAA